MRFLSREGFFGRGLTTAVFSSSGTDPADSDVLMMCVTVGRRTSMSLKSSLVGMGSSSHNLGGVFLGISKANWSETGAKASEGFPVKSEDRRRKLWDLGEESCLQCGQSIYNFAKSMSKWLIVEASLMRIACLIAENTQRWLFSLYRPTVTLHIMTSISLPPCQVWN